MNWYLARLQPLSPCATAPLGDTWFGQLCWAIVQGWGETRLGQLLDGYTAGHPFAVLSDALPAGYLPRPELPETYWHADAPFDVTQRKERQKLAWVPRHALTLAVNRWLDVAKNDQPCADTSNLSASLRCSASDKLPWRVSRLQPRNHLNRLKLCTDEAGFSPYTVRQTWYSRDLELIVWLDPERLEAQALRQALEAIVEQGFGKDASVGLGKFRVCDFAPIDFPTPPQNANACLTLAPCAPQGLPLKEQLCFYKPFVRYGRHGNVLALTGAPFKLPLLMAHGGAVLTPTDPQSLARGWIGQGLGGATSPLSFADRRTVHQGYAPALPIYLEDRQA